MKLGFNSPQGGEKVIEIISPGQTLGEALMFLEKPYIVFARALHELSAAGLIEVDGGTVRILDLEGLRGYRV